MGRRYLKNEHRNLENGQKVSGLGTKLETWAGVPWTQEPGNMGRRYLVWQPGNMGRKVPGQWK
jgi:hypothetical protein